MKRRLPLLLATLLFPALPFSALAAEPTGCIYVELARLPVRYVGLGLAPAVDGSIDGTPATMLVDTGAFDTVLTMTGVARRDLVLLMTGRHAEGFGGLTRLYSTRLEQFAIGPVQSRRSVNVGVVYEMTSPPSYDGIVGAPFLLQADFEVDLRARQLRFFRPRDCSGVPLKVWPEHTFAVPFVRSLSNSPNPHFTVKVNGKELEALIDTGAHRSLMTRRAARRIGIDVDAGGPGVTRLGDSGGVGAGRAASWAARVDAVEIGDETVRDAELHVVDAQGVDDADLYLGQDFLRSHRVLFAMSQRKLYIAYLGGDVFTRGTSLEPWMQEEADNGNPDAQYTLAMMYGAGRGAPRDPQLARSWLEKAAAAGQPHANLALGRQRLLAGHPADAIPLLRKALDQLPAEGFGPLWLYNARVRNGEPELARKELATALDKQHQDDWPQPLARFYLGKIDAARLLDEAGRDRQFAAQRSCQANGYMAEWYAAGGDQAQSAALLATVRAQCGARAAPAAPAPRAEDADKAP
ncbi:retroviral-like aspartic protease family protein [uncultured Massilia sp.]|uniref:retroviral-like aspartic protease family protein n=1 Tax=uncultured Massilia sp. TaxID=169973 RepID=UPI0025EC50D7|nr:retroviral-like aspartic protease family protein [uncultured Massilia sp.]